MNVLNNNKNNKHSRRMLPKGILCLAVLVVFITTYMLILPAITMEHNTEENGAGSVETSSLGDSVSTFGLESNSVMIEGINCSLNLNADGTYYLALTADSEGTVIIPDNFMDREELVNYKESVSKIGFDINADTLSIGTSAFEGCISIAEVDFTNYECNYLELNSNAFKDCIALKEINIPSGLIVMGEYAFSGCSSLNNISFGRTEYDENNLLVLSSYVFKNCSNLLEVDLTPLQNLDEINAEVFYGCSNLVTIKVPGNVSTLHERSFGTVEVTGRLSSLSELIFEENYKLTRWPFNVIRNSALKELDLRPLKTMVDIGGSFTFPSTNITSIWFPKSLITMQSSVFRSITSIKNVYFEEGSQLSAINTYNFLNNSGLVEIDLSVCKNLKSIANMVFSGSSIKEIVIPESVTYLGQAFAVANEGTPRVCAYLKDIYFNAKALNSCDTLAFGSVTDATFTIGNTVDTLPVNFIKSLDGHASKLVFKGENEFTVVGNGTATGLKAPLDTLGGDYYVSPEGDLYKVDKKNNTATLIYKENIGEAAFVVPKFVGMDGSYSVTGIGAYAFRNSEVISVDFENIDTIESVDINAFVQSEKLESINGYTSTVDVISYFKKYDILLSEQSFYETALVDAGTLPSEWQIFEADVNTTGIFEMSPIQSEGNDEEKYEFRITSSNKDFLTGQEETITVYASGSEGSENVLRLYFESEDDCTRLKEVQEIAGCPVKYVENVDDTHVSYYEIGPWTDTGSTGILQFKFCYQNLNSGNDNHLKMWAVSGSKTNFDAMGENLILPWDGINTPNILENYPDLDLSTNYFDIKWNTLAYSHPVSKSMTGTPTVLYTSDKLSIVNGLSYTINLQDNTNSDDGRIETDTNAGKLNAANSYGSDFALSADFEDVLILPEGLKWREGLLEAIKNRNYSCTVNSSSATIHVNINDVEYLLCTINRVVTKDVYYSFSNIDIDIDDNENLLVKWTCENTQKNVEIQSCSVKLAYGDEIIIYDEDVYKEANPNSESVTPVLINKIKCTEKYTYAEDMSTIYETSDSFDITGKGKLTLTKETVNTSDRHEKKYFYFGEDVTYKITASNPTAYVYSDLDYLSENLKSYIYIKPENIVKMFKEADKDDEYNLTIKISGASFTKPWKEIEKMEDSVLLSTEIKDTVYAVDKETKQDILSSQFIGNIEDYSVTYNKESENPSSDILLKSGNLEFTKNGDNLSLKITYNSSPKIFTIPCTTEAVQTALNNMGYIITSDNVYSINYDYLSVLEAGESKEHYVYTTFKDSLMKTGKDAAENYSSPNSITYEYSNGSPVVAYNHKKENILSSTFPTEKMRADIGIYKKPDLTGVDDETVIDYLVNIKHYGSGSYEVLPVVDNLTGIQAVLVSISDNANAEWAKSGLETYNEEYYILMPPEGEDSYTFEGVMVGNYYADSVTVNVIRDANGYVSDIQTLTKWYLTDTAKNDFSINFRYKALVDLRRLGYDKSNIDFSVKNTAYAGDRAAHRIYDACYAQGTSIIVDKNIVTEESSGGYEYDVLAKKSNISQGTRNVTYRLEIDNPNEDTPVTINGKYIHDQLPLQTLEEDGFGFEWIEGENISIRYAIMDGVSVTNNGVLVSETDSTNEHWYLTYEDPKTSTVDSKKQQFICWSEDFKVKIAEECTFYIYVTLNFPGEDSEQWTKYVAANDSPILYNTFYCGGANITVSHDLVDSGRAFLQKGVYELGYYPKHEGTEYAFNAYYASDNRLTYKNTTSNMNYTTFLEMSPPGRGSVAYYILLANTGNTKLYLSTIYDQLPEGFAFYTLRNNTMLTNGRDTYSLTGTGVGTYAHKCQEYIYESSDNYAHPLAAIGSELDWTKANKNGYRNGKSIKVTLLSSETVDGHQQLAFELSGGILDAQTDEIGSYLEPGQWITFGYECLIGYEYQTENVAENTLAMRYIDPNGTGVDIDYSTPVEVSERLNKSAPNDGTRELWSNAEALRYGFTTDAEDNSQWLTSQVSVYRGSEVIPGISKTVLDENTQNQVKHSNVNLTDIAKWNIKVHNDGDVLLSNYTIEDTLESPHHFVGTVNYSSYTNDRAGENYVTTSKVSLAGDINKNDELFTILERDYENETSLKITTVNGKYSYEIPFDGTEIKCSTLYGWGSQRATRNLYVSFIKDDVNKTETLRLRFEDDVFGVNSNGYNQLEYQTQNITKVYNSVPTLYNTATLIPHDTEVIYNYSSVKGSIVTDRGRTIYGVQDRASISTDVAFPTTSLKTVSHAISSEDGNNITVTANGEDDTHSIVVNSITQPLTYTLTVNNAKSRVMNKLVIIDNLPQYGDSNTLSSKVTRESEFKVKLYSNPDFKVSMTTYTYDDTGEAVNSTTRIMESDEYTIEYSTVKSGDFTDADWQGLEDSTSEWKKWDESNPPSDDVIQSIRSIRLVINDGTVVENNKVISEGDNSKSIPEGASITLTFDAVIDDDADGEDIALAGETAWNTFGYEYLIIDDSGIPNYLFATPQKVGISMPTVPTLSKNLVNSKGAAVNASEDETFKFVIYQGDKIGFNDYTYEAVGSALAVNNKEFTYVEVKVPEGSSASEVISLENLKKYTYTDNKFVETDNSWEWDYNYNENGTVVAGSYNIVELDSNIDYRYITSSGSASSQNYEFKYDPLSKLQLKYVNMREDWEILLLKTDGGNKALQNAIFGLYSPNESDALSEDLISSLSEQFRLENVDKTISDNGVSYYLCDVSASNSDGRISWTNLCEEKYIVRELLAPDGYEIVVESQDKNVIYPYEENQKIVYMTVVNKPGVILPATGGEGWQLYILGLIMVLGSVSLLLIKYFRIKRYT